MCSLMCLALLRTSTHSSHLKYSSEGGINSLRHQVSHWLTATEKYTVGWTDTCFSGPSVHLVPPPRHVAIATLLTSIIRHIHRQFQTTKFIVALCPGPHNFPDESTFLLFCSIHPTLLELDRRFIRWCLLSFHTRTNSSDGCTDAAFGVPSVHPTSFSSLFFL
jgi:hypothetical protein